MSCLAELRKSYVTLSQTKETIRNTVRVTQQDAPLVLIDMETGHLFDKSERADKFEADPKFAELVASMTRFDKSCIQEVVREYFRYATFSHTWEGAEPLFHEVLLVSVYKLGGIVYRPEVSDVLCDGAGSWVSLGMV